MLPSAPASSISSDVAGGRNGAFTSELVAALASWRAMFAERWYLMGISGGMAVWVIIPMLQIVSFAIIYGSGSPLLHYLVVAQAANVFVMNTVFWVGEILDRERVRGTLVALFLAPCSRSAWLSGFILAGAIETIIVSAVALLFGRYAFGVRLDPNLPAVAVTAVLFLSALWGMGLIFSGLGLLIKKSNPLANLIWSVFSLLGGAWFPVSALPDPLRYAARCLPLGYGMQALADSSLRHASLRDIAPDLVPLACFAVFLPAAGILTFGWLERAVRVRGELDLY
jgi:ABC-2 type transport system permease protein